MKNGDISFWADSTREGAPRYEALGADASADVVIVGAGLTGLWAAHYLREADPALRITVLEAETVGFGASGRNGGWLAGLLPGNRDALARRYGRPAVLAYLAAIDDSVDESIRVAQQEGIEADIVNSGTIEFARSPSQQARLLAHYEHERDFGGTTVRLLDAAELAERMVVAGALGAVFHPQAARIQPAKLVRGLAAAVAARGVRIHEHSRALEITPGRVVTRGATITAPVVLRATEGFTTRLPGGAREFLAMNSSMVVTAPQSQQFWDEVGWAGSELIGDAAHDYVYGQRTADGRIALGGRGVPYHFRNGFDARGATAPATVEALRHSLLALFPSADPTIEHTWSGVLAVARDWNARVTFDRASGMGAAGGYVGHGVAATNLAGRTLRDLVLGRDSDLTALPWVGHGSRAWEPEPLRWLGVRGIYAAYRFADAAESRRPSAATSIVARIADVVSGRP